MSAVKKPKDVPEYMSRSDVARYLGLRSVRSLSTTQLPREDVRVGRHKGYLQSTIDKWLESRPGKGRWGKRAED